MRVLALCTSEVSRHAQLIADMHALRQRIFRGRLKWDISSSGIVEVDSYDALGPTYLIGLSDADEVVGCARLLPTTGPTMLANTFPALLGGHPAPCSPTVFESSRFCVDTAHFDDVGAKGLREMTFVMLAAVLEWGLYGKLDAVVTVTDTRFERILKRASWPLERFAPPQQIGNTQAVAGRLPIAQSALSAVRQAGDLAAPVLVLPRGDCVAA
ncbi:acyl-homoserine-lactone synthase [Chelatococcus reniformis]|uniref:Acyl-homoserine-lactone synthase n=1 Tax=Chelatococcus reniformis TaxID=1494448 RepID=A0A916XPT3_9HYPH|nr:acyl-homoserine-lactone synthase [Chelatococcus reniformis]GGC94003.1 putative acyl-homoserine-lactone synthase [Chelatococcus reniformis]